MKLFWYEIVRRDHTQVALQRPRTVGELVRVKDSEGCIVQNWLSGMWAAYTNKGQLIGRDMAVEEEAKELLESFLIAKMKGQLS